MAEPAWLLTGRVHMVGRIAERTAVASTRRPHSAAVAFPILPDISPWPAALPRMARWLGSNRRNRTTPITGLHDRGERRGHLGRWTAHVGRTDRLVRLKRLVKVLPDTPFRPIWAAPGTMTLTTVGRCGRIMPYGRSTFTIGSGGRRSLTQGLANSRPDRPTRRGQSRPRPAGSEGCWEGRRRRRAKDSKWFEAREHLRRDCSHPRGRGITSRIETIRVRLGLLRRAGIRVRCPERQHLRIMITTRRGRNGSGARGKKRRKRMRCRSCLRSTRATRLSCRAGLDREAARMRRRCLGRALSGSRRRSRIWMPSRGHRRTRTTTTRVISVRRARSRADFRSRPATQTANGQDRWTRRRRRCTGRSASRGGRRVWAM